VEAPIRPLLYPAPNTPATTLLCFALLLDALDLESFSGILLGFASSRFASLFLLCFLSVRSSSRKVASEQELYLAAIRALGRRAHSIHEMREYLARRAEDAELVSPVIARLRERKYLEDARYALEYARLHANSRRQGRFRIARELRTRGVPDHHIDAALDAVFAETDEATLVRARLKRRLAHVRGALAQRHIASLYRSLLRAGFSADIIRSELRAISRNDVGDLPEPVADEA